MSLLLSSNQVYAVVNASNSCFITHIQGRKPFSFYDGPPFATGLPHYGHLLAGTIKVGAMRYDRLEMICMHA